jgi:enediyne biosynthesis protein E4
MKKLLFIPVTVLFLLIFVFTKSMLDKQVDYDVSTENIIIPTFEEKVIDFDQLMDDSNSLPFIASAIIDIDNDGTEELFLGGGSGQNDAFYHYSNGVFERLTEVSFDKVEVLDVTFGSSVIDVDRNGYSDLIISRTNGVWLYLNEGGRFTETKLALELGSDTSPLSVAISDINRDGHFDLYVAGYIRKELVEGQNIFNKEGYGGLSRMFLNNGDNTFTDITRSSGLEYRHNTFMGIFVDIDNDSLEDLVVAHDTGHVKTWRNLGNSKFEDMPNPNSKEYSYPMGIAVTDYNNNDSVDFFFSNVGSTPPRFLVTGDLRENQPYNFDWIMFENLGNFKFKDIAQQAKLADYEFSWGAIFEDFNLDGRDDLVVSENYIGFPAHKFEILRLPGRFLMQTENGEFAETGAVSNIENTGYSISPITADFNNDGYPDVVHINIAGRPKAFINKGGNANYLKVKLTDNIDSIGARIRVKRSDGVTLYRDFVSGEGLCSDQSHVQIFGLEKHSALEVTVKYLSGEVKTTSGEFKNEIVNF